MSETPSSQPEKKSSSVPNKEPLTFKFDIGAKVPDKKMSSSVGSHEKLDQNNLQRQQLNDLKNDIEKEQASHEKVKEIQSLLEKISFDESIRKMVDSVLQTKKIPAGITKVAQEQFFAEKDVLTEILSKMSELTSTDMKIVQELLVGDLEKYRQAIALLPQVVIEITSKDGQIRKIPGGMIQGMFHNGGDNLVKSKNFP